MRYLLCALVVVLPAASFSQDTSKDAELYPLRKGSKWTYKSGTDNVEVVVKDVAKVEKEDVYEMVTSINNTPMAAEHVVVRKDGVYRVKIGGLEVKPPMLFLKFPVKKGESWQVASAVGPENLGGKLTIGETKVKWDNKDVDAITVTGPEMTANGQKMSLSYTFVKDVGMFATSATIGGAKLELTLTKYEPGKD